jgi:hypothetical protein
VLAYPTRIHAGSYCFHQAGGFVPEPGRQFGRYKISPSHKPAFGSIQADRLDPQLHFAFAWLARRKIFQFQILRTADTVKANNFSHASVMNGTAKSRRSSQIQSIGSRG